MKLQKTVKIKIGQLSKNKQNILDRVLRKNAKAINFCLQKAKENKYITHELVYKDLRKLNLPSTIVHGCRAKSVEIIKSYKKIKKKKHKTKFPELKNNCARYDNVSIKLRKTDNKLYPYFVSLLYKATVSGKHDNRIELPLIVNSDYQKEIIKQIGEEYKLGSTELVKRNNDFYIHISYSKEINLLVNDESFSPIGIDIGINNLAVSVAQSSVRFFSGHRVNWKNEFFREQRTKLQKNFAFKEIKRLKGKQVRYNNFYINNIAKNIVEQAKQEDKPVIVMEDLTNIRATTVVRKKQRARHNSWMFSKLQKCIEYKANWEEIPVVYLDPRYSSQICSKCGELNKRIRHTYKCKSCGFEANADYNAGRNLQRFFKDKFFGEQVSINHTSDINKLETKSMKDISVRNLESRSL